MERIPVMHTLIRKGNSNEEEDNNCDINNNRDRINNDKL